MSEHVYKIEEIVGSSEDGIEEAIEGAIARAGKTLRNLAFLSPWLIGVSVFFVLS